MAITSLSEVTNDYGSYRGNSLIGERGTAVTVPNDGLDGIIGKNYPFLSGILIKIGESIYTDQGYLNALKRAGNPYISKSTLPMVSFPSLDALTQDVEDVLVHEDNGPVYRTQYAEVAISKRMSTVEDILFYLNDFFNPRTTDEILSPGAIGSFNLLTTTYSADLDVNGLYPGLEFEAYEDIANDTVVKPSLPPTQTEPKKKEPPVEVELPPKQEPIVTPPPKDDKRVGPVPEIPIGPRYPWPPEDDIGPNPGNPIELGPGNLNPITSGGSLFDASSLYEQQELMRPTNFGRFFN